MIELIRDRPRLRFGGKLRLRRPARRLGVALGLGAGLLVAGLVYVISTGGHAAPPPATRTSTYRIVRRTIAATETASGTLGFASGEAQVADRLPGIVTTLPAEGSIVPIGGVLFRVGGEPVVLMRGTVPASRSLGEGVSDGADVRQLEENLRALGFDPYHQLKVDTHFDAVTRAIVERWQRRAGVSVTGTIELGRVVFAPGTIRVGKVTATLGASGGPVMTVSTTQPSVAVKLDTSLQTIVAVGDAVTVELPDARTVQGRITEVGRVATTDENAASGATIDVTVRLPRTRGIEKFDQAPVSVSLVKERRKNVLAVPVTALVAQAGGGYAVEVRAKDGTTHFVPVDVGLFASGYVEISGAGIAAGTRVAVPSA